MNAHTQIKSTEATAPARDPVKDRLFRTIYVAATAAAMLGWLYAFGWITIAVAKRLLA